MPRKPMDISGQRFGLLVAVERTERTRSNGDRLWLCHCDCGGVTYASAANLRAGFNLSCGCRRRKSPEPPGAFPAREDCWAYDRGGCRCLLEMFCRTRGKCKFYDTEEDYERKQKGTAAE